MPSNLPDDEQYQWDTHNQIWSIIKYDYGTKLWGFKQWMPRGWSPTSHVAALSIGAQGPSESAAYVQDNEVEDDEDEDDEEDEEPSSGQGYMADSQPEFHQGQPFQSPDKSEFVHNRNDSGHSYETPQSFTTASQAASSANIRPTFSGQGLQNSSQQAYGTGYNPTYNQADYAGTWAQVPPHFQQYSQQSQTGFPGQGQYAGPSVSGGYQQPMATFNQPYQPTTLPTGRGQNIQGTYHGPPTPHYEPLDRTYYVRPREFFFEGRVFAVIMNETAGSTSRATDYNSSFTTVKYDGNVVFTNVRRFIVVRRRKEFCFACPIFTYGGRATTKPGVNPAAHGIVYSWGGAGELLPGEHGITKMSIPVVGTAQSPALTKASRIYYGIHHPIQYNVKVKEFGYVPPNLVNKLIENWREEDQGDMEQEPVVTQEAAVVDRTLATVPEGSDLNSMAGPSTEYTSSGAQGGGNLTTDNNDPEVDDALTQSLANVSINNNVQAPRPQSGNAPPKQQSTRHRKKR